MRTFLLLFLLWAVSLGDTIFGSITYQGRTADSIVLFDNDKKTYMILPKRDGVTFFYGGHQFMIKLLPDLRIEVYEQDVKS